MYSPTGKYFNDLKALFEMMFRNLAAGEPQAELFCSTLMHALLVAVLTVTDSVNIPKESRWTSRISSDGALKSISTSTIWSRSRCIAWERHCISARITLSHVFKQMSGYSPVQYLLRRRIGEAQTLLITTDLSITRIAEMVGYDTQSYFNLQFTKNVGMPPNKFRQNYIVPSGTEEKPRRRRK